MFPFHSITCCNPLRVPLLSDMRGVLWYAFAGKTTSHLGDVLLVRWRPSPNHIFPGLELEKRKEENNKGNTSTSIQSGACSHANIQRAMGLHSLSHEWSRFEGLFTGQEHRQVGTMQYYSPHSQCIQWVHAGAEYGELISQASSVMQLINGFAWKWILE